MPTKPTHLPQLERRKHYSKRSKDYREEIREDSQRRCVYCDIHEDEAGGGESMTLDHFRPKGGKNHPKYPQLRDEPTNLVWACQPCNKNKADDWPAFGLPGDPTVNGRSGYIDPFLEDRRKYFELQTDGSFKAIRDPAEYMIGYLELNRPFVKTIRRKRDLIYEALAVLESLIENEIAGYKAVVDSPRVNGLEKVRWTEDLKRTQAVLEVVDGLDRALRLG